MVRRYCAANGLNRLGTLTYAGTGCHDPALFRTQIAEFFRNLRTELGGRPSPYLWVPELHETGHGLHGHFAIGRFVKRSAIERAWGHGFVHIKLLGDLGDLGVGSTARDEARPAAAYLSKYMAKAFGQAVHEVGGHRYDVAQGFQPPVERITATPSEGFGSCRVNGLAGSRCGSGIRGRPRIGRARLRCGFSGREPRRRCSVAGRVLRCSRCPGRDR